MLVKVTTSLDSIPYSSILGSFRITYSIELEYPYYCPDSADDKIELTSLLRHAVKLLETHKPLSEAEFIAQLNELNGLENYDCVKSFNIEVTNQH